MTTKFIGLKELRQNMAVISREAVRKRQRLIVLKKNVPIFELHPLSSKDIAQWTFQRDIFAAQESARTEKTYTTEEVVAELQKSRREIVAGKGKKLKSLKDLR